MRAHLDDLIDPGEFTRRHISPTSDDRRQMLSVIGEDSVESLLAHTVPAAIRMPGSLALGPPRSPESVLEELRALAGRNNPRTSLIGMGYYGTITPPVVVRNVLENPAWYTAYTPYQPEISQGRLEALLNIQTMVAEITGLDLANASLLDEATAAAEAMTMARRLSTSDSNRFVVHHDTHPQTIAVLATRAEPVGIELVVGDVDEIPNGCFGALFSLPTSSGAITDWTRAIASVHHVDGLAVVATDLMACMLTVPPAHLHADIAIGSAQRFGVSMGFGGPHAAFIAADESVARALPGRLVGVSTDTEGRPAMRLALQCTCKVSNQVSLTSVSCADRRPSAAIDVSRWIRSAMRRSPSGPCHAA
jgi:glycine dehydrogenase